MAILPCGIHFETYRQDMAYIRTKYQWACLIGLLVLLMVLPLSSKRAVHRHDQHGHHDLHRRGGPPDHHRVRRADQPGPIGLHGHGRVRVRGPCPSVTDCPSG